MSIWLRLAIAIVISLGAAALGYLVRDWLMIQRIELAAYDWRAQLLAEPYRDDHPNRDAPIRLILLDEDSLRWARENFGLTWPWQRDAYIPLVEFCRDAGVRTLVFDSTFLDPSQDLAVAFDETLGDAIATLPLAVNGVVTVAQGQAPQSLGLRTDGQPYPAGRFVITDLDRWLAVHQPTGSRGDAVASPTSPYGSAPDPIVRAGVHPPLRAIVTPNTVLGDVAARPDIDSRFRRMPLFRVLRSHDQRDDQRGSEPIIIPSLALAAFAAEPPPDEAEHEDDGHHQSGVERWRARGMSIESSRWGAGRLRIGDRSVAVDHAGRALLRFPRLRPEGTLYPAYPVDAIINSHLQMLDGRTPEVDPADLRGAVVFFGASAPGLRDLRPTPMGGTLSGVEVHAAMFDNLSTGRVIATPPIELPIMCAVAFALAAAVSTVFASRAWRLGAAAVILTPLPALVGVGAYAYDIWLPIAWPMVSLMAAGAVGTSWNLATEGRQRRLIRRAFGQYLSGPVIERVLADRRSLTLGGQETELTMLFADIAGFSRIAQALPPAEVTALLNDCLTELTRIVFDEGGTLDKYQGDGLVAFWNAPTPQADHALRGLRAAAHGARCAHELEARWSARAAGQAVRLRFGVHTGRVLVGNMGSPLRFDYTMLGDAANLASRLEGANKAFGTQVLCSQATWTQALTASARGDDGAAGGEPGPAGAGPAVWGREIGPVVVVGRSEPVVVFEPWRVGDVSLLGDPSPQRLRKLESLARDFAAGLTAIGAGRVDEARSTFAALADEDLPARLWAAALAGVDSPSGNVEAAHSRAGAFDGAIHLSSK